MTQHKKLKQAIRARARRTGERYAAARRQVLLARQRRSEQSASAARPVRGSAPAPRPSSAKGAVSDAAVVRKTGQALEHWFAVLDSFGATKKGHAAAADHLYSAHGIPGWHAQGITVAYERARGLRALNQSCTGKFQVSASKVVPASVREVAQALGQARQRFRWLRGADPDLAGALEAAFVGPKAREVIVKSDSYARLRFPWDGSTVEIRINAKPRGGGASVVADNKNLADPALVERRRAQWRTALESLKNHLSR